jgi:hypothetical protein
MRFYISKPQFNLKTSSYDYNIEYIISLIEEKQIVLEIPNKLWTKEKASKLIESSTLQEQKIMKVKFNIMIYFLI